MRGLMMDWQLTINSMVDYAGRYHATQEIVTRTIEGPIHRYTFADMRARSAKLADALSRLGVRLGDRIGSLAFNTHRHLEMFYGVTGLGAVLHTVNPRLFPEQIIYIVDHAEDQWLFADLACWPIVEALGERFSTVKGWVVMTDRAHMPETKLKNVLCYEDLIDGASADFVWPQFDENTAATMCYTSGTTGNPKGVLYSHRSIVLATMAATMGDVLGAPPKTGDVLMPISPFFHANGWMLPFTPSLTGNKMVLPGRSYEPEHLLELLNDEGVTVTAAVPTIWNMLIDYLDRTGKRPTSLSRVLIGGSAPSEGMLRKIELELGIEVFQGWGMTETSAIGTKGGLKPGAGKLPWEEQAKLKMTQGRGLYGVELRIVDDAGNVLPPDGQKSGLLQVRGPWIASGYFKGEGGNPVTEDGWLNTGDVARLRPDGYMLLTDRAKDVIKSGGEWISSIDLENTAASHPEVLEAAVIAAHHPKWDERPLLVIVRKEGSALTREAMLEWLAPRLAKWWLPDDVVFVDEIPHTATGKISKLTLRQQFKDYVLPTVEAAAKSGA